MGMRGIWRRGGITAIAVAVGTAACSSGSDRDEPDGAAAQRGVTVEVVSSRPEYVSGGDALVAVTVADDAGDPEAVEVRVGDRDGSLDVLRRGYATATATFNTFQVMCNDVLSAETVSMVKERFVEAYGEPAFTIGEGGSGGAIQQLQITQNYPGLLNAIAPSLPFPDALSIGAGVFDCRLLVRYYATPEGSRLSDEQRMAVNGHGATGTCPFWDTAFSGNIDVVAGCRFNVGGVFGGGDVPGIPPEEIYDPETNPDGRRCSVWDANAHVTGRDPETGHVRSGYDNQGVQYGLDALNAEVITPDQFVDLNVAIGGFDADGQPQAERSAVDDDLVARAYETGRVTGPWGGIPDTPTILISPYLDEAGDIHDRVRAYSLIDRLVDEDGALPDTVSVWLSRGDGAGGPGTLSGAVGEGATEATFVLDEWLTAARQHQESDGGSWREALAAAKPESATSRCQTQDAEPIVGPEAFSDEACLDAQPPHEEPRMAAGGPRAGDILKCQLVPVDDATDQYEVELSDEQLDRLAEVFPDGVCDWSQPSVGHAEPTDTWLAYPTDWNRIGLSCE